MVRLLRPWSVWLLLIAAVLLLPLALWLFARPSPIHLANHEKIMKGMTEEEVEAVLGGPPGDYRRWPHASISSKMLTRQGAHIPEAGDIIRVWVDDEREVVISCHSDGYVREKGCLELPRSMRFTWFWQWLRQAAGAKA